MDTSRPTDIETIELIECEGTLRRDVPPELRAPNAAWVLLRRYISAREQKTFNRRSREIEGRYTYPEGAQNASEEHIAERESLINDRIFAYIVEWRERDTRGLPLTLSLDALDELPSTHRDALAAATIDLMRPPSDEDAFRLAEERRRRAVGRNGHESDDGAAVVAGGVVAAHGPALPGGSRDVVLG